MTKSATDIFSLDILAEPVVLNLASDTILIGNITRSVQYDGRFYLLGDDAGKNSITVVDAQGKHLKQIQRTGRGPLEYLGLNSIFVDRKKELLGAYSRRDQKIIYLNNEGSGILNEIKMPKRFQSVWQTDLGYVGDMSNFGEDENHRDNLWLMDPDFVLQDSFFEIPISWESTNSAFFPFSSYKNITYYTRLIDNNIYSIEKNRIGSPYKFDFGKNNWPDSQAGYDQWRQIATENPGRYVGRFDRFQETDDYIILQFLHEGQVRLGVFDKKSEVSTVCSLDPYTGKYFIPFGKIVGIDTEAIYTVIDADRVKRLWNGKDEYNDFESDYPDQIRRLREDFPAIDEYGNPFLVIYRFKNTDL